ncbi:MAG TPA: cytochrome c oxidase assembly protein [Gemmatimonadales bacterium]|nr:cytochrome c oxidase assembly protein [Gemmatimonadales bacterium]
MPELGAILLGALLYGAWWIRLRVHGAANRAGWRPLVAWTAGLGVTALALLSPLGEVAHQLFWVHMVQHELLIFLAAPLFLAGLVPLLAAGPTGSRAPSASLAQSIELLARPLPALGLSTLVLWLWHAPAAFDFTLTSVPVHALEHLSFLGAYLVYWRPLMRAGGPFPVLGTGASRALYLLAGGTQAAVLGALLAFAQTPYYRHYMDTASAWGFTPLGDQQLGGAVMLLSGALAYVVAAAFTIPEPLPAERWRAA